MKLKTTLLLSGLIFLINACSTTNHQEDRDAILNSMKQSQEYWNKGDLKGFMHNYWHSDSLKFIGKSGVTYGWQASLDRYLKSYPDRSKQGTLNFDLLHLEQIDKDHYFQVGKYTQYRAQDTLSGHFTLLWERIDGEWKIIVDHSS